MPETPAVEPAADSLPSPAPPSAPARARRPASRAVTTEAEALLRKPVNTLAIVPKSH